MVAKFVCLKFLTIFTALVLLCPVGAYALSDKEQLGKDIFFDTNLSSPNGQSCASCHDPDHGFVDPDTDSPTSQGILPDRMGPRNAPTVTYLATAPEFKRNPVTGAFTGGQFLDGRAFDLFDLAGQPFVNPIEMHSPNEKHVIQAVRKAKYAPLFEQVYGLGAFRDYNYAYDSLADALQAFMKSSEVNRFDSKYDYFLKGEVELTDQELEGLDLFQNKADCDRCHVTTPNAEGGPPVFTSFGYSNVGVPKNPNNAFYYVNRKFNPEGLNFVDPGLGGFLQSIGEPETVYGPQMGKFNFPTLRNIAKTAPYFHNGVFPDLKSSVHFVNTRDVDGVIPEEPRNVTQAVGNLGLTDEEEDALVAFLETLTDGYEP